MEESPMEYGLFAMPLHPPHRPRAIAIQRDIDTFILADKLGYSEGWMGEHFTLPWEPVPAPDIFIAHVLPQTKNIMLGTGVVVLPFHDPRNVAMRIAYLDQLAKGRLYFGIGPGGGFGNDFELMGVASTDGSHRTRTFESIEAILKIWEAEPPFEFHGEYYDFKMPPDNPAVPWGHHMRPFTKPHPQIMVAGSSRRSDSMKFAGAHGWIPISLNFCPPRLLKTHWDAYTEGAAEAGIPAPRSIWRVAREIWVAPTDAQALDEAVNGPLGQGYRGYQFPLMKSVGALGIFKTSRDMPDEAVTAEYLAETNWIVGSPDTVVEKIRALYDDVGGFGGIIQVTQDPDDWGLWERNMTQFATEVMPKLKDLTPPPD
jgi:alkanesulfonate monooxygenase SsuD/methylene tetrahydromethanopterin reductase-like flavin-dependent oxidoreductase (luciferase family)